MAAFVLTLVPAAAFAGNATVADSSYTVTSDAAGQLKVTLDLQQADKAGAANDYTDAQIKVTVTNLDAKTVVDDVVTGGQLENAADSVSKLANGIAVVDADEAYTFTNVPVGNHTVTVELKANASADFEPIAVKATSNSTVYVSNNASVGASKILTSSTDEELNNKESVTVDPETTLDVKFNVQDVNGNGSNEPLNNNSTEKVYVWAVNEQGQFTDAVTFTSAKAEIKVTGNDYVEKVVGGDANGYNIVAGDTITAHFNRPGTYTIVAGVAADSVTAGTTPDAAFEKGVDLLGGTIKVTINPKTFITKNIVLESIDGGAGTMTGDNNKYEYTIEDGITPNGIKVYTVKGHATTADGKDAQFETLNISCVRNGLELLDSTVGTDANGDFSFRFTVSEPDKYTIKIAEANGDATAELVVNVDAVAPLDIKTTEQGGTMLAGNDATYSSAVYAGNEALLTDAVQFEITDVYGDKATDDAVIAGENAHKTGGDHNDFLSVSAPKGSDLKADELTLVWDADNGVYTLKYDGNNAAKDLIPGEYTVKVSLNNGKTATATFKLAKFGTVQNLSLGLTAAPINGGVVNNNAIEAIDDQVALGQKVTATVYYVDENGIKVKAPNDLNVGVNGSNSASVVAKDLTGNPISFETAPNLAANESLVGTTITVKVLDENTNKYVEKELTVVKSYLAETLAFDPTNGVVNDDNDVTVSVVDENGDVSKVNGKLYAFVESQSNADANIELDVNETVKNGKGTLSLYSDAEGTADVVVVVTANNGEMYGATLTYTFGAEDPNAENTVVMTIGSTDYVVNNDIIKGDAAPYVDAQWRTMVPFRVLGETFGAEVNWDQDSQTVTYTVDNTELTMTIGEETYTLNGEEKTMDTAPVLSGDRTYVPVRFVGEALGYTVTALQDTETGLTASVVFQK